MPADGIEFDTGRVTLAADTATQVVAVDTERTALRLFAPAGSDIYIAPTSAKAGTAADRCSATVSSDLTIRGGDAVYAISVGAASHIDYIEEF